jgi:hypothetical protein
MMPDGPHEVGLCADCRFARVVESSRGSRFYLCLRAETDPLFRKYPRLPVLQCSGHEAGSEGGHATCGQ